MPVGTITFPTTIDSDQTLSGAANNVTVLLDQAINSSQTTIAVASATFFPAAGFATIVDNLTTPTKIEIISYTQISGNTLQSVIRGAQGTTPQSFSTGYVEIRPTAGHHLALVDAVIAIENRLGTGSTLPLNKGGTGRAFTTMPGADRIFFWDASANSMQLLELGTNLSITGTVLNATGGGVLPPQVLNSIGLTMPGIFTVTPPIITVQEFSEFVVTANNQTANTVYAGPTTGAAAVPAFRSLVADDIPSLPYVTSVGLSLPNIFTVTNSPVTSSGTLTATLATQAANLVLVGPINAPAAVPTFRLLEDEDIPNVLTIHKNRHLTTNGFVKTTNGDGTYAVDTSTYLTGNQTVTLSGDVTGSGATSITTTIANGAVTYGKLQNIGATSRILGRKTAGAGSTEELTLSDVLDFVGSAAQGDILYRGSTGWARLAAGTNGQYLQTQGTAANPQWATVVAGGTPGGSSGQVQFNSAGSFGGVANSNVASSGAVTLGVNDAVTNARTVALTLDHSTSGTPAANFGTQILFTAQTSGTGGTTAQPVGSLSFDWYRSNHATRQGRCRLAVTDYEEGSNPTDLLEIIPFDAFSGTFVGAFGRSLFLSNFAYDGSNRGTGVAIGNNYLSFLAANSIGFWQNNTQAGNPIMQISGGRLLVGSQPVDTAAAGQIQIISGLASRVGLRVDSAASPTTDIAQFTVNGTLGAAINKDARIILAERSSNPTGADLTSGGNAIDRVAIYMINDKIVFAMNDGAGNVNYLSIPVNGSTTAWAVGAP